MKYGRLTLFLGLILILAGNVSAQTLESFTVSDDEDTPSWEDKISVEEGTEVSPVYWGEGFSVQEVSDTVQILDYQTQETVEIQELGAETLYQDYIINLCSTGEASAEIVLTMGREDIESLCGEVKESHSYGESISVRENDEIVFGSEDANSLEVDSIREDTSNDDSSFFEFTTGQGMDERIVFVESRESGRVEDVEFETGEATIFVEELSTREGEAVIRIERDIPQSSNFDCPPGDLEDNQYAFCSDEGDSAVQNVDLGHSSRELEYHYNNRAYGLEEEVAATFTDSDEMTLTVTDRGTKYKQADIDIVEWRGLRQEYDGARQQAIIEVDPVENPEASIDTDKSSLNAGESFNTDFEAFSSGRYRLEVEGAGLSQETSFDESEDSRTLDLTPEEPGEVRLNLIAPGNWWNPLDSDRVIDEETVEVDESIRDEYSFGENIRLSEGESTTVEGRNFYLSSVGPDVALWRPERSSNSNTDLNLLDNPTRMEFRYSDGFRGYGYLCDLSSGEASIVVESEEENPWQVCGRNPSELRDDSSDYDFKEYDLGKKVTVSSGEGLEFGESRVYIEEISDGENWKVEGYKEWRGETTDYSAGPINYSTTDYFYEGELASGLCDASQGEAEIVIEDVDNIDSDWPQSHCTEESDDSRDSEEIEVNELQDTPSWEDKISVEEGTEVSPVYWGEGFRVESIDSQEIVLLDYQTQDIETVSRGVSETSYQDYVIHACRSSGDESSADIVITTGQESTPELCESEAEESNIELGVERTGDQSIEVYAEMDVPNPCFDVDVSEASVSDGRVGVMFEPVESQGTVCSSQIVSKGNSEAFDLEPGNYSIEAEAEDAWGETEKVSQEINIEEVHQKPNISPDNAEIDIDETIILRASPEDQGYVWDIDGDGDYEREGNSVELSFEEPGEKQITAKIHDADVSTDETVNVKTPEVSSRLELSKDEVTAGERLQINYETGEAVARNGYSLIVEDPEGNKVIDEEASSTSGTEVFAPGEDSVSGTYTVTLVEDEGFLSSILRGIFGSDTQEEFEVLSQDSDDESRWMSYCREQDFNPDQASGRVSCLESSIGPECFTENPSAECREIGESVCEYYTGNGFDPEEGRCLE